MTRIANTAPLRQREPSEKDRRYLSWLHDEKIPCIACLIEGHSHNMRLEAAHQHLDIAAKGWTSQRGKKVSDSRSVIPCLSGFHP